MLSENNDNSLKNKPLKYILYDIAPSLKKLFHIYIILIFLQILVYLTYRYRHLIAHFTCCFCSIKRLQTMISYLDLLIKKYKNTHKFYFLYYSCFK